MTHRRRQALIAFAVAACLALPVTLAVHAPAVAGETGGSGGVQGTALDSLFAELKSAGDVASARTIEQEIWNAWLASGDDGIDRLMGQAIAAMQASQLQIALAMLDAVVSKAPAFAEGWNKRATVLFMLGQHDRSLEDCGKVLALEPRHFGALSGVGLIRIAKGDMAGALSAYRKVIEIYPLSQGARANIEALEKELDGEPL
jgi:tetratricopeptide (TPR) repeat protein